jgi:hypothetical protein
MEAGSIRAPSPNFITNHESKIYSRAKSNEQEGADTMRARSPKHPFLCDSRVPFQELIFWQFRSNWRFRSISIARQPFLSFRSILIYFDLF